MYIITSITEIINIKDLELKKGQKMYLSICQKVSFLAVSGVPSTKPAPKIGIEFGFWF